MRNCDTGSLYKSTSSFLQEPRVSFWLYANRRFDLTARISQPFLFKKKAVLFPLLSECMQHVLCLSGRQRYG